MVDWIPVVSQVKSLVQVIAGDVAGAKETQDNFSRQCPIVAPMRAAVEGLSGDTRAAEKTMEQCAETTLGVADSTPLVGR